MSLPTYVYHLIEAANWQSVQTRGLLSAADLVQEAFPATLDHATLIRSQRTSHTVLPTGVHIRDQKPMPADALKSCLVGMAPSDWYALVNAHIFFWFDPERLSRQRDACGSREQYVAVVPTESLVAAFSESICLTPFNIGYALRRPAKRGEATLVPYKTWQASRWQSETSAIGGKPRSMNHEPAELLVRTPIPQFAQLMHSITELRPGQRFVAR